VGKELNYQKARDLLISYLDGSEDLLRGIVSQVVEEGYEGKIEPINNFMESYNNIIGSSREGDDSEVLVKEIPPRIKELSFDNPNLLLELCFGWAELIKKQAPDIAELVEDHPQLNQEPKINLNSEEDLEKIKTLCNSIGAEISEVSFEESALNSEQFSLWTAIKIIEKSFEGPEESTREKMDIPVEKVPITEGEENSISDKWQDLLSEIESWPTSEDVWDEIGGFLQGVKRIAEEKKKIKLLYEKILGQLRTIKVENSDMLEFFGFSALCDWANETLDKESAEIVLENLQELKESFASYSVLHERTPENIVERRNLRGQMAELENKIGSLFKRLEKLLFSYGDEGKGNEVGTIGFKVEDDTVTSEEWEYNPEKISRVNRENLGGKIKNNSGKEILKENQNNYSKTGRDDGKKELFSSEKELEEKPKKEKETKSKESQIEFGKKSEKPEQVFKEENGEDDFPGQFSEDPGSSEEKQMDANSPDMKETHRVALAEKAPEPESEVLTFGEKKLWEMIGRKDLPGAYWVSKSLEKAGEDPLASGLIKALQSSWWLPGGGFKVEKELRNLASDFEIKRGESERIFALAAALVPSILAPQTRMQKWLFSTEDCPELANLIENIQDFADKGIALKIEDMQNRPVQVARKERIKELSLEVEGLLAEGTVPNFISEQGQIILKNLLKEEGELFKILDLVAKGKRRNLEKVEELLQDWQGEGKISRKISQIHSGLSSLAKKVLKDYEYREMTDVIIGLLEPVEQWCNEINSYNKIVSGDERYDEMVQILQSVASVSGPKAIKEVREVREKNKDNPKFEGALNCLLWSLGVLLEIFKIDHDVEFPSSGINNQWWIEGARNIDQAMSKRFYWVPEISTDESGYPNEDPGNSIVDDLYQTKPEKDALVEVGKKWLEIEDFSCMDNILKAIEGHEEEETIKSRYHEEREKLSQVLGKKISQTEETIESAMGNGFINEEQKKRFKRNITAIEPEKVFNFKSAFEELNKVRQGLDKVLEEQTDELQAKEAAWAWLQLRFRRQKGEGETRKYMETLFQFLGFLKIPEENSFKVISSQNEFLHLRQRMSSSDPGRLFPQFASRTENQYDTVCFWEEPGADTLGAFIQEAKLDTQALIVIYFGKLSPDQRKELIEGSKGDVQVAVLDESLILEELGKEDNALAELTLEYLALKKKAPGKK